MPHEATKEHMLVGFLEPQEPGGSFIQWPLHVTLLPWFTIPNLRKAETAVKKVALEHEPMDLQAGEVDQFRTNRSSARKVTVTLIQNTPALQRLHDTLYDRLKARHAEFTSEAHMRKNYNPHVTFHGKYLMPGSHLTLDMIYMIEAIKGADRQQRLKQIIGTYSLWKNAEGSA